MRRWCYWKLGLARMMTCSFAAGHFPIPLCGLLETSRQLRHGRRMKTQSTTESNQSITSFKGDEEKNTQIPRLQNALIIQVGTARKGGYTHVRQEELIDLL
mmetsp:Transcript_50068/g.121302  ORF Transcript_50068/g.121302 Transcript_50068/m.121302 type:complete len:101 (-) Transcript_50068:700-1002(-)